MKLLVLFISLEIFANICGAFSVMQHLHVKRDVDKDSIWSNSLRKEYQIEANSNNKVHWSASIPLPDTPKHGNWQQQGEVVSFPVPVQDYPTEEQINRKNNQN
ncbi:hypothetical protein DdX_00137 [Ditylenchus destructor]|uniref:Uncharacterized protein n=1 Tax=Ditylenchus destructor TaxID=166010 RepID=A0AAD4NEQ8_9BILA|nr:hypothetical protein DdX_00137 [Ditylenchus destructor]